MNEQLQKEISKLQFLEQNYNQLIIIMETAAKIYGTLFIAAIAVGLIYSAYALWNDNFILALLLGLFGLVMIFYSVGLFLLPLIESFKKKK